MHVSDTQVRNSQNELFKYYNCYNRIGSVEVCDTCWLIIPMSCWILFIMGGKINIHNISGFYFVLYSHDLLPLYWYTFFYYFKISGDVWGQAQDLLNFMISFIFCDVPSMNVGSSENFYFILKFVCGFRYWSYTARHRFVTAFPIFHKVT